MAESNQNEFSSSVESLLKGMENFLTTKTVVGDAIHLDDTIILPLVNVTFGCGAGSVANGSKKSDSAAGGITGKISPSAVLVIQNGNTKLVTLNGANNITKAMDMIPDLINKFIPGKEDKVTVSDEKVKDAVKDAGLKDN
ncbi:hypothetical protein P261_00490 [Lachnospiraceae bacterium TWA4]|nr:hypothetical protein P261_00490 [Lachnospiraceae bacterium TWA4]